MGQKKKRVVAAGVIASGVLVGLVACDNGNAFREQCEALGGVVIEETELVWQPFGDGGFQTQELRDCVGAEVPQ